MTIESKSQFAKRINRAPSYITELLSHGRLVLDATGKKIDVEASLKKLAETSSGANPAVAARHESARAKPKSKKIKNTDETPEIGGRAKYKSMVLHYENQQIKIEMMLRRGLRFELADARRESQSLGNTLRASLERLVDQTAPRLSVMKSKSDRLNLLSNELKKLKTIIKAEFPRAMRRLQKGKKD